MLQETTRQNDAKGIIGAIRDFLQEKEPTGSVAVAETRPPESQPYEIAENLSEREPALTPVPETIAMPEPTLERMPVETEPSFASPHVRLNELEAELKAIRFPEASSDRSGNGAGTYEPSARKHTSPPTAGECISPTVSKLAKLIAALPPGISQEAVIPFLQVTMETANISPEDAKRELIQGYTAAHSGIAFANEALAHAQTETELQLVRAQQIIERAKQQLNEIIAVQQLRIARYEQEQSTLACVANYLGLDIDNFAHNGPSGTSAPVRDEKFRP